MEGVSSITAFMGLRVPKTPRISRPPWAVVSAPRAEGSRSAAPVSSQKTATVVITTINNYTQRSRSLKTPMIPPLPNYTIPTPPTVLSSPKENTGSRNPPWEGHGTPACTSGNSHPAQGEPPPPQQGCGWAARTLGICSQPAAPQSAFPWKHPQDRQSSSAECPPEKTHVCPQASDGCLQGTPSSQQEEKLDREPLGQHSGPWGKRATWEPSPAHLGPRMPATC